MLVFWGNGSQEAMDLVNGIRVRSTESFNWTFIFILAVVFYVYWTEFNRKNYESTAILYTKSHDIIHISLRKTHKSAFYKEN